MTSLPSVPVQVSPTAPSKRKGLLHCVHYYKDAMLNRFYAICNCCSCCCGAMQAWNNGTPMLASSGYVAQVDVELCAACGTCADFCQFAAISLGDGFASIDASACMGCGVCVARCPQEALSLQRDPAKGEPLEIRELMVRAAK
jgi:ferredoxin